MMVRRLYRYSCLYYLVIALGVAAVFSLVQAVTGEWWLTLPMTAGCLIILYKKMEDK